MRVVVQVVLTLVRSRGGNPDHVEDERFRKKSLYVCAVGAVHPAYLLPHLISTFG